MSADFDKAIDRALREMLDVEPPAGLRRRVIEQLPAFAEATAGKPSTFKWKILLPVAAAALLILGLLIPRSTPPQPEATTAITQTPVTAPTTTQPVKPPTPQSSATQGASSPPSERRMVTAAVAVAADPTVDAPPAPGFPRLPALTVPELSVSSIQLVAPVEGPGAIATDPIATPNPLAIEPLSAQGRQSQE